MAVVVECENVLVRNSTVEARLARGVAEYEALCPNQSFCTDGIISRIGFMQPLDARAYIEFLGKYGFLAPNAHGSPELALFSTTVGFLFPCDWLQIAEVELDEGVSSTAAALHGGDFSIFVAPPGWKPQSTFPISNADLERDYEFAWRKEGVLAYRHRKTGQLIYSGSPRIQGVKKWWEFWK